MKPPKLTDLAVVLTRVARKEPIPFHDAQKLITTLDYLTQAKRDETFVEHYRAMRYPKEEEKR